MKLIPSKELHRQLLAVGLCIAVIGAVGICGVLFWRMKKKADAELMRGRLTESEMDSIVAHMPETINDLFRQIAATSTQERADYIYNHPVDIGPRARKWVTAYMDNKTDGGADWHFEYYTRQGVVKPEALDVNAIETVYIIDAYADDPPPPAIVKVIGSLPTSEWYIFVDKNGRIIAWRDWTRRLPK